MSHLLRTIALFKAGFSSARERPWPEERQIKQHCHRYGPTADIPRQHEAGGFRGRRSDGQAAGRAAQKALGSSPNSEPVGIPTAGGGGTGPASGMVDGREGGGTASQSDEVRMPRNETLEVEL